MATKQTTRSATLGLVRHFFEMVLAMILGMAVLGSLVSLTLALLDQPNLLDQIELRSSVMATNMKVGMSLWMRYRGHNWAAIGEMAAAMYVPLAVLAGPFWAGALSDGAFMGLMHVLMLPAMLLVMLRRRREYAYGHGHHSTTGGRLHPTEPGVVAAGIVQRTR